MKIFKYAAVSAAVLPTISVGSEIDLKLSE
jgi:hypothetical protein